MNGMKNKNKKICFISSSGGHLEEIKQLIKVKEKYSCFYIVAKTKSTEFSQEFKYRVNDIERKSKLKMIFSILVTTLKQCYIFIKENPDVIVTTGPGMVIPTCLIGKIFKRKLIFIESFARVNSPSKTGKMLYKYSDLFIIQSENLKQFYPNSIYGGGIF